MRLRQIVEQRRGELPTAQSLPTAHACLSVKPNSAILDVTASDGVEWQFPWQHFTSACHSKEGDQDCSVLTFVTHRISVRGYHFAALREAIRESRLAMLRVGPTKYVQSADGDPFITAVLVTGATSELSA